MGSQYSRDSALLALFIMYHLKTYKIVKIKINMRSKVKISRDSRYCLCVLQRFKKKKLKSFTEHIPIRTEPAVRTELRNVSLS